MGLDVYLHRSRHSRARHEELAEIANTTNTEVAERFHVNIHVLPDAEQEAAREEAQKKVADALIAKAKEYPGELRYVPRWNMIEVEEDKIEIDSTIDPDHLFKIGYFRSSYNDGGINNILRRHLGDEYDLSYIFNVQNDSTIFPDWQEAKVRVRWMIEQYEASRRDCPADVMTVGVHDLIVDEKQALAAFKDEFAEFKKRGKGFLSYSNRKGFFDMRAFAGDEAPKIVAVIPGARQNILAALQGIPPEKSMEPCAYVIFANENSDNEPDHYLTSLKIVEETIDYVLASGAPEEFYLYWSG